MNFLHELKRRNVFKAAIAYAVVSWIVLQIASITFPNLNLPDWTMTMLIVFILIGFPFVMVFAWAFELTPEGIKLTKDVEQNESVARETGGKLNTLVISGLVIILALVVLDSYLLEHEPAADLNSQINTDSSDISSGNASVNAAETVQPAAIANLDKSIAVLPFSNLSSDPEQEYFSDGLTEEILNKLARVQDLQVAGRTSSFFFKGKNEDLRTIGEALGVNYILEGSVRKSGEALRITAQLIQANNGFNLWSDTFDRPLQDIFAVQDEIATAVTQSLSISLGAGEFDLPGMTRNVQAYEAVIKARETIYSGDLVDDKAFVVINEINHALELDPEFAIAWQFLGEVYNIGGQQLPPDLTSDFASNAETAYARAKELAPEMPEIRMEAARRLFVNGNWLEAEQIINQLLEENGLANPGFSMNYGMYLTFAGHVQEATRYLENAIRLDPLNGVQYIGLPLNLIALGRTEDARETAQVAIDLGQLATPHYIALVRAAIEEGDWTALRQALTNGTGGSYQVLGNVLDALDMDDHDGAVSILTSAINDPEVVPVSINIYMHFLALLGEYELVMDILLEKDPRNSIGYQLDIWNNSFSEVRKLPAFKEYLNNLGLADYWIATGNWPDKCRPLPNTDNDFECF